MFKGIETLIKKYTEVRKSRRRGWRLVKIGQRIKYACQPQQKGEFESGEWAAREAASAICWGATKSPLDRFGKTSCVSTARKLRQHHENPRTAFFGSGKVMGIELRKTCGACPEQYEAFCNGKQVAHLHLRSGVFTVTVPDSDGYAIMEKSPDGDGTFFSYERETYLAMAREAIISHYAK